MGEEKQRSLKDEVLRCFSEEYIRNTGVLLHSLAEQFYDSQNMEGSVYFNDTVFKYCLIDVLVDLARLKYFHDITYVNYIKLISYAASWCIKRKPFQLLEGCGEEYLYVNEKFALCLLIQAAGCLDENSRYEKAEETDMVKNLKHVLYHLKYRNTNPQTLELLLVGIQTGKHIHI